MRSQNKRSLLCVSSIHSYLISSVTLQPYIAVYKKSASPIYKKSCYDEAELLEAAPTPSGAGEAISNYVHAPWLHEAPSQPDSVRNELEEYINAWPHECADPLQYWIGCAATHPRLSKVAMDLLAIPSSSAECQKTFSLSKLIVSSQRHLCWLAEQHADINHIERRTQSLTMNPEPI